MKKTATFIAVFALFIFSLSAYAADFHVNGSTGTDSGSCGAILAPCKTIGQAVTNAGSGIHVVKIAIGNYSDNLSIDATHFQNISISGGWNNLFTTQICDPQLTILQPSSGDLVWINVSALQTMEVSLYCMTFRGNGSPSQRGIFLDLNGGTDLAFEMSKLIIEGIVGEALRVYGSQGSIQVGIEKTEIRNNLPWPHTSYGGSTITVLARNGSQQTLSLNNSLVVGNQSGLLASAVALNAEGSGSSINLSMVNTTAAGNTTDDSNFGCLTLQSSDTGEVTANIKNSIFWGNPAHPHDYSRDITLLGAIDTVTVYASYSHMGYLSNPGGTSGTYIDNGHNINADPRLSSSYHLNADSPAIGAAQCGYNALSYHRVAPYDDIDGDSRPGFGELTGCDIGADEYVDNSLCFPTISANNKIAVICL